MSLQADGLWYRAPETLRIVMVRMGHDHVVARHLQDEHLNEFHCESQNRPRRLTYAFQKKELRNELRLVGYEPYYWNRDEYGLIYCYAAPIERAETEFRMAANTANQPTTTTTKTTKDEEGGDHD